MSVVLRIAIFAAVQAGAVGFAWAADGAAGHDAGGGGNPVQVDLWQSAYTIIIFLALLAILSKYAFRPVVEGLQKREKFIRESVEAAERASADADARMREYEAKLDASRAEATKIVEEGRRDAEALRRKIEEQAQETSAQMVERAKREIGLARDTALKTLFDSAAELAASVARSTLKRQLTPEEHQRLMKDAMRELADRPNLLN